MELSEHQQAFDDLGIQIAVMTYEPPEVSRKFSTKHDIRYPILTDTEAKYVQSFGILNEKYEPGHRAWGIPHPGIFLVDSQGIIRGKFAEADYRDRPDMEYVIQTATDMVKRQQEGKP